MRLQSNCTTAIVGLLLVIGGTGAAAAQQVEESRAITIFGSEEGGYLGIEMEDVTAANMQAHKLSAERGVIVKSVRNGSPAESANLQAGDVIVEYEGMPVSSAMQLARMVRETPPGRNVNLAVSRDGNRRALSVKIGKRERPDWPAMPRTAPRGERNFGFDGPGIRFFQFGIPGPWDPSGSAGANTEKPRLGVTLVPLTDQMAEFLGVPGNKGVLVTSVAKDSPAAARLQAGDVIVRANDQPISEPAELARLVRGREELKLDLRIVRDKKLSAVIVVLPDNGESDSRGGYRL